jgi:tRNA pseudouridine13 synthase
MPTTDIPDVTPEPRPPGLPDWPRATGQPRVSALLRVAPEDFVVEEQSNATLSGAGEHLWIRVRKRGYNTDQVAGLLAKAAGVPRRNVGYAGMKDRHALTTQWFSIQLPGSDLTLSTDQLPQGIELLEQQRHARKLPTGGLVGNRFVITLRECQGDLAGLELLAARVRIEGVPNYFGEQRFGHGGANIERARALFAGRFQPRDRHVRGVYLSAARAFLFNEVLARRVAAGTWNQLVDGEACLLAGSHSFFPADPADANLPRRLAQADIHPSGPLWGRGDTPTSATARDLETHVAHAHADLARGLEEAGLRQERRSLRMMVPDLTVEVLDGTTVRVAFMLPRGSYATAVLRELVEYRSATTLYQED